MHVNSQHRNTDNALDGPIAVYELAVNKQNVEIDRFDNEASRVIALACLGYNVWYLSRGRNRVPAAS